MAVLYYPQAGADISMARFVSRMAIGLTKKIENESHFSLEVVDQDLSSLAMFTKHLMGEQRKRVVSPQYGGEKVEKEEVTWRNKEVAHCQDRSMDEKDGLGGAGGGEVNRGGIVLRVSKHFSLEFIIVLIGDSGRVVIGEVGGAPDV
ncbi:hypothetical protein Tco_0645279 [Tanacetum coccineum]